MEEKIRQGDLFDYYGELLKPSQKSIVEAYVCEDLSLSEIAESVDMTRQGVFDIIKRATKRMEEYENALHLIERFSAIREDVGSIKDVASDNRRVAELCDRIIDKL